MTRPYQVAFDVPCLHLFTQRHDEFTCCNDTVTASDLVGGSLGAVHAGRVHRSPISAHDSRLSNTLCGLARCPVDKISRP